MNSRVNLIEQIFEQQWIARIAIYLLAVVFFYSGLDKTLHFSAARAEFDAIGLQHSALLVVATIVTQLAGAILLCSRRFALYGAFLLIAHLSVAGSRRADV